MGILSNIRNRSGRGNAPAPGSARKKAQRKGPDVASIVFVVMMLVGAAVIAYPTFSDWWNSYHQSRAIADYVAAVDETDPETIKKMLAEAHAYNNRLLKKSNRFVMNAEEKAEYQKILDITGTGVMGYIQINSLGISYPIYHGLDEAILQVAIGHMEGTSLPVGGASTHCAVSGHRGLPSAKLFSNLDKMVEGDTFTITVLDQTVTYEVDQIRIVLPKDTSALAIEDGADQCTLITCTPYGVNTHRLLVRGHRINNIVGSVVIPAEAVQIPNYVAVPAVALPMLFVYLAITLGYYHMRGIDYDREKVMSELNELKGQEPSGSGPDPKDNDNANAKAQAAHNVQGNNNNHDNKQEQ